MRAVAVLRKQVHEVTLLEQARSRVHLARDVIVAVVHHEHDGRGRELAKAPCHIWRVALVEQDGGLAGQQRQRRDAGARKARAQRLARLRIAPVRAEVVLVVDNKVRGHAKGVARDEGQRVAAGLA